MLYLKKFLFTLVAITPIMLFAKTIKIDDFSPLYYAEVNDIQHKILIKDKKTKKILIRSNIEDVDLEYEASNNFQSNVVQRPYGDQSLIIYEDFNFDGKKDFAIKNGNHSCYGGPSFLIYLKKGPKFYLDDDFTRIAQEYCGMFGVDNETKTIHAMTKSGCCWHLFDTYKVENGKLKLVNSVEETYGVGGTPFVEYVATEYKNGKEVVHESFDLAVDEIDEKFSFKLTNGKKVILFENQGFLYYILMDKEGRGEFAFNRELLYDEATQEPGKSFIYITGNPDRRELHFNTEDARYTIYQIGDKEKVSQVGITVETKGKLYDLKGLSDTVNGNLEDIDKKSKDGVLKNVLVFRVAEKTDNKFLQSIYEDIKNMTPKDYMRIENVYNKTTEADKDDSDKEKIDRLIQRYKAAILNKNRDELFSLYYRDHLLYKFYSVIGESKSTAFFERELLNGYTYDVPKDECKAPRLLHYPKEETKYNGCWVSVAIDDIVDVQIKDILYEDDSYQLNVIFVKRDGSKIYAHEHIEKIKQSDGEMVYVFGNYPG
jgi:hypothetical protein